MEDAIATQSPPAGPSSSDAYHFPQSTPVPLDQPISLAEPANIIANGRGIEINADMAPAAVDFSQPTVSDERVNAFARLRFDDGSYYMHTYQIILGRNIALAHKDMRRLAKVDQLNAAGHSQAAQELLNGNVNGKKDKKRKRNRPASRSVISEKGGIVNAPIESMPIEYHQHRQSNASLSHGSPSNSNDENSEEKPAERASQDMIMQAFPQVPAQFDGHVPEDPNDCPLVPIHPQHITAKTGAQGPKGISRHHAKIFFDFEQGNFCVQVLGSNGLHHENQFIHHGEIVPLDHGDRLLIGAVNIQFYLPDNTLTEDQRHRQESGSRPMSFSFENGQGEMESEDHINTGSEGDLSVNPRHLYHVPDHEEHVSSEDWVDQEDLDDYEDPMPVMRQKQSLKLKIKAPPLVLVKEAKRSQKRKYREPSPDEPPVKKNKGKSKDLNRESIRESKAAKEAKDSRDKGKTPAKTPAKGPAEARGKENFSKERVETSKPAPSDSPPLLRKPFEGEMEAGEIDGLITEEMARQHNLPASLIGSVVEKRKGPGRPPKDGIMSKRQRSQLIKQAKDIERAKAAGIDPADIPAPTVKPKPPKRKESNAADEDDDVLETTEKGDGHMSGDRKQKSIKPPRTPSPEMRIEDYTKEQLQRPSANYVVLIHEAISSSATQQMNLQQIYNYIERKYPWYKFKTATTGWQSSVRHNLGQHDAFIKGDKEGKGFNWRVNPDVSIEKERRKRQISPPINHAQRQPYYPPPNGYPPYPQPGYPYHPGMPQAMPGAPPRLPPSLNSRPRLPPSLARDGNTVATIPAQGAMPHASPYASPWAGGSAAGSPPVPNQAIPYPPSSSAPPGTSAGPSGQYGVLYPTTAPQLPGGSYATAGAPRPYAPYATAGQHPSVPLHRVENAVLHPSGRYPLATHPDLIPQLEAFRKVYLDARTELGEDKKVDNAIRACVDTTVPEASLTDSERLLLKSIRSIEGVAKHLINTLVPKKENQTSNVPVTTSTVAAGTAAAIAADAAKNSAITQSPSGKHYANKISPSKSSSQPDPSGPSPSIHRPSVEPLTPLPGSPAIQDSTPAKREIVEVKTEVNMEGKDIMTKE